MMLHKCLLKKERKCPYIENFTEVIFNSFKEGVNKPWLWAKNLASYLFLC